MIKQPLDSSKIGVPVPQQPGNFQEAMTQLQTPIKDNTTALQRVMEMKNKTLPYATMPALDLNKALSGQFKRAQDIEAGNVRQMQARDKMASDMADIGIKYNQSLLQQELTERSLYTKQATEQLMASQQRANKIFEMKVDPSRFFKDVPTWQKIVGFVGIVAAGVLNARAGYDPNQAFIGISNLIEQDVLEQTRDLEWEKYKDQKIDMMDSRKLKLMAETISSRNHVRNNLTAITNSYIKDIQSRLTDQPAISSLTSVTNTLWKTAAQEHVKAKFAEKALKDQARMADQVKFQIQNAEQKRALYADSVSTHEFDMYGGPKLPDGAPSPVELERQGRLTPSKIAELKLRPDQVKFIKEGAHNKNQIEAINNIPESEYPYLRREAIQNVRDWRSESDGMSTAADRSSFRTLRGGNKVYGHFGMSKAQGLQLQEEFGASYEHMAVTAQALEMVDGYMAFTMDLPNDVRDATEEQKEKIDAIVQPYFDRRYKELGIRVDEYSPEQHKKLKDRLYKELDKKHEERASIAKQAKASVGVATNEKDTQNIVAIHELKMAIRRTIAESIRILTAEGGKRITKEEYARAVEILTGEKNITNFNIQDFDPFESIERTRAGLDYLLRASRNAYNRLATKYTQRDYGGLEVEAAIYSSAGLPNDDAYNIIRELHEHHNLPFRHAGTKTKVNDYIDRMRKYYYSQYVVPNDIHIEKKIRIERDKLKPKAGVGFKEF